MFHPSRAAGLAALEAFLPHAGSAYTNGRNYDLAQDGSSAVSQLSPYIRHRLISEDEVARAVLSQHSPKAAEKYLQEVYWRTYWKGWLQMRPSVWAAYLAELQAGINRLQTESGLRGLFDDACLGQTDVECFNSWSQDLVKSGYLHNHARMWFASIWIFTLRLPWALGADFFMRHLLDGDPASNTLSWRWVAGLQTKGKTYLATADNIEKFTRGRFRPDAGDLATFAMPLEGPDNPERIPISVPKTAVLGLKTGVLIHDDDMEPPHLSQFDGPVYRLNCAGHRSPLAVADQVTDFVAEALTSTGGPVEQLDERSTTDVAAWATSHNLEQIVTPFAPVGPVADALDKIETKLTNHGIALVRVMRLHDQTCWPKATHGFFRFKEHIPDFIAKL